MIQLQSNSGSVPLKTTVNGARNTVNLRNHQQTSRSPSTVNNPFSAPPYPVFSVDVCENNENSSANNTCRVENGENILVIMVAPELKTVVVFPWARQLTFENSNGFSAAIETVRIFTSTRA